MNWAIVEAGVRVDVMTLGEKVKRPAFVNRWDKTINDG